MSLQWQKNCRAILRRTELFEGVEITSFLHVVRVNGRPLLDETLCVDNCGKKNIVGEQERIVVLGTGEKGERG